MSILVGDGTPPHHSVQPCRTLQAMLTDGGTLTSEKVEGLGTTCDRAATLDGCHFLLGDGPKFKDLIGTAWDRQ